MGPPTAGYWETVRVVDWARVLAPMEIVTPPGIVTVAGWVFETNWITVWIGVATGVKVTGMVAVKVGV